MTAKQAEFGEVLGAQLATLSPAVSTSYPGIDFDPPAGGAGFLEVTHFRNRPQRRTIGGDHIQPGIYQVAVVWPKGRGPEAEQQAEAVADLFPADLKLNMDSGGYVRITQTPQVAQGLPTARGWEVPVSIFYEAHGG